MNNKKVNRVSLLYKKMPAPMVVAFMGWVIQCMTDNPAFPEPPVLLVNDTDPKDQTSMTARMNALQAALANAEGGGVTLTAAKNAALQYALDGLDANAFYVQTQARYDLPTFLSSGYQAVSTNRGQSPLKAPGIVAIDNAVSTQLDVHVTPVDNAVGYEVQTLINNVWTPAKFSTQARTITLTGLTTGTVTQVRARALGGSTGQSDWSDVGSKMVC